MGIAILGGGLTGLTAAYYLAKKGHQVTIFEKEKTLGGLASGFKNNNWDWYLERTVHHLFANDDDILNFAKEIGFNKIFFKEPETASLYENPNDKIQISNQIQNLKSKFKILPLDTPLDLLKFPYLNIIDKLRAGIVIAFLKLSPFFSFYERQTAEEFLKKYLGKSGWERLFRELFRKKFGKYAGNILSSFIWARIKKRTKKLSYVEGGFQVLINYIVDELKSLRVNVLTSCEIREIKKKGERYFINSQLFDAVISTLPTPVLTKISEKIFPEDYLSRLKKVQYLHSLSLVLETERPILEKTYWLNISAKEIPIMGIFQQTNFIDKKYYGGKNISYLGWYVGTEDRLWKMEDKELLDYVKSYLNKIFKFQFSIFNYHVFRAPYTQPIFNKEFLKNKPEFVTPLKNFFIANLDMTYPYDRGTNYAVKLGKEVSKLIL